MVRKNYIFQKTYSSVLVLILFFAAFPVLIVSYHLSHVPARDINEVIEEIVGESEKVNKYSFVLSKDERKEFNLQEGQIKNKKPLYYSVRNMNTEPLTPRLVINGRGWYTLDLLLEEALRGIDRESDKEVLEALWKFVAQNSDHAVTLNSIDYEKYQDPLKFFNIWGYGLCSDSSGVLARLSYEMGYPSRTVQLNKHIVTEVYYDSDWHMYDTDFDLIFRDEKGEVLSVREIIKDKSVLDQITSIFGESESIYAIQKKVYSLDEPVNIYYTKSAYCCDISGEFGFSLMPEEEIRFYYDWPDRYFTEWVNERPERFTNGMLLTLVNEKDITNNNREDRVNDSEARDLFGESVVVDVSLPYPILGIYIVGKSACRNKVEVVVGDTQDKWETPKSICKKGYREIKLNDFEIMDNSPVYKYSIKMTNANPPTYLITQFQVSKQSLPNIRIGYNNIKSRNFLWGDVQVDIVIEE